MTDVRDDVSFELGSLAPEVAEHAAEYGMSVEDFVDPDVDVRPFAVQAMDALDTIVARSTNGDGQDEDSAGEAFYARP